MQIVLSDHNCEGQVQQLIFALNRLGLAEIALIRLVLFNDVGLPLNVDDETVWRLCQEKNYLLVTGNRRTVEGEVSLEMTIRRLYAPDILPVLTIGDLDRVMWDREYCESCAESLAEIVLDVETLRGITRLYLP
jgi:hypothetical protein